MARVAVLGALVRTVVVWTSPATSTALRTSTAAHGALESRARLIGNARAGRLLLVHGPGRGAQSFGSFVFAFVPAFVFALVKFGVFFLGFLSVFFRVFSLMQFRVFAFVFSFV
jgi:hypothetical protein